ncbi:hypothetical protein ACQUZK_09165 [Streptococcus pyogenes]|uniref:hypothetical protein n=1 Tax=Streptococcus pyogenes TaxID=1314 RepID=UPI003DA09E38
MTSGQKEKVEVRGVPPDQVDQLKSRILDAIRRELAQQKSGASPQGVGFGLDFSLG